LKQHTLGGNGNSSVKQKLKKEDEKAPNFAEALK